MPAKVSAAGSLFKIGTAGGSPATTIGQVRSGTIDLPDLGEVDVTTASSDANASNEWVPGTFGNLEANVTVAFDGSETGMAAVMTAYTAKTKISFGFIASDAGQATVYSDGYVKSVKGLNGAPNAALEATISLKGTGAFTYTA